MGWMQRLRTKAFNENWGAKVHKLGDRVRVGAKEQYAVARAGYAHYAPGVKAEVKRHAVRAWREQSRPKGDFRYQDASGYWRTMPRATLGAQTDSELRSMRGHFVKSRSWEGGSGSGGGGGHRGGHGAPRYQGSGKYQRQSKEYRSGARATGRRRPKYQRSRGFLDW